MVKRFMMIGCTNAFLAVALGAFGAHALKEKLSVEMLEVYKTGIQYHMIHAIALIITALIIDRLGANKMLQWAGRLFTLGIVLFAGSLYVLSIADVRQLGIITPFGGVCFLGGWLLLALSAKRNL